eukprot:Skav207704  [mRNA]  locus=scaffold3057:245022:256726:- [translate_table: standard]
MVAPTSSSQRDLDSSPFTSLQDYYPPDRGGACVVTKEGAAVVQEAIDYVRSLEKMDGVGTESQEGLALAAADHVWDIGQTGTASHSSSDGTTAAERATRYGHFALFGECLWYGSDKADARCMVLDLIVDDGVPSRGHRKGVLDPRYDTVGVAYGPHSTFGQMAAMEFAKGWEADPEATRVRVESGPFKMSPEAMTAAKSKAETAWSLGHCPICRESIKGGKVVDVAEVGGKLHAACFKCTACSTSLVGKTCFYEKFGEARMQGASLRPTSLWQVLLLFGKRLARCAAVALVPIAGFLALPNILALHRNGAECLKPSLQRESWRSCYEQQGSWQSDWLHYLLAFWFSVQFMYNFVMSCFQKPGSPQSFPKDGRFPVQIDERQIGEPLFFTPRWYALLMIASTMWLAWRPYWELFSLLVRDAALLGIEVPLLLVLSIISLILLGPLLRHLRTWAKLRAPVVLMADGC